jgi:hypothetical protein
MFDDGTIPGRPAASLAADAGVAYARSEPSASTISRRGRPIIDIEQNIPHGTSAFNHGGALRPTFLAC